ncbi:hypothetical protein HPB51_009318 [Rhipicephalus microplus]|uniref:Uncharacterized protein n=1 Tax=Rhipicephalus microplus TaxID=6941 RepID=A0A9J6EZW9_RHIMP|nr:hypothetical protein HPB51_009318 [Rhipicephalus microplus]
MSSEKLGKELQALYESCLADGLTPAEIRHVARPFVYSQKRRRSAIVFTAVVLLLLLLRESIEWRLCMCARLLMIAAYLEDPDLKVAAVCNFRSNSRLGFDSFLRSFSSSSGWSAHWENCDRSGQKHLRQFYRKPSFLPLAFEMTRPNWVIASRGFSGRRFKELDFEAGSTLVWFAQVKGLSYIRLVPESICSGICQELELLLDASDICKCPPPSTKVFVSLGITALTLWRTICMRLHGKAWWCQAYFYSTPGCGMKRLPPLLVVLFVGAGIYGSEVAEPVDPKNPVDVPEKLLDTIHGIKMGVVNPQCDNAKHGHSKQSCDTVSADYRHGAIVMLYHPCTHPYYVDALRSIVTGCLRKHIITPYVHLSPDRPLALVAWGCRYEMSTVDQEEVVAFIKEKAMKGPEGFYPKEGQYTHFLLKTSTSPLGSDMNDTVICPGF